MNVIQITRTGVRAVLIINSSAWISDKTEKSREKSGAGRNADQINFVWNSKMHLNVFEFQIILINMPLFKIGVLRGQKNIVELWVPHVQLIFSY